MKIKYKCSTLTAALRILILDLGSIKTYLVPIVVFERDREQHVSAILLLLQWWMMSG